MNVSGPSPSSNSSSSSPNSNPYPSPTSTPKRVRFDATMNEFYSAPPSPSTSSASDSSSLYDSPLPETPPQPYLLSPGPNTTMSQAQTQPYPSPCPLPVYVSPYPHPQLLFSPFPFTPFSPFNPPPQLLGKQSEPRPQLQPQPLAQAQSQSQPEAEAAPKLHPLLSPGNHVAYDLSLRTQSLPHNFPLSEATTNPPCPAMTIVCDFLPWSITVPHTPSSSHSSPSPSSSSDSQPLTLATLLTSITTSLRTPVRPAEFSSLPQAEKDSIKHAYTIRCAGQKDEERKGVKRVDYLKGRTRLEGLEKGAGGCLGVEGWAEGRGVEGRMRV